MVSCGCRVRRHGKEVVQLYLIMKLMVLTCSYDAIVSTSI